MSASDRPTPVGECHYRDTIEAPPPDGCDLDERSERETMLPGEMTWAGEETI